MILDDIWWLIGIALMVILAASAYRYLAKPIYSADAHVRVEPSDNTSQALTQTQTGATIGSSSSAPTDAEIEIIKSRGVVAPVVAQCKLNFSVAPVTLPVLGSLAARLRHAGARRRSRGWVCLRTRGGGETVDVGSTSRFLQPLKKART